MDYEANSGATALIEATDGGHAGVVRAMLEGQAAVDYVNSRGVTALMVAVTPPKPPTSSKPEPDPQPRDQPLALGE